MRCSVTPPNSTAGFPSTTIRRRSSNPACWCTDSTRRCSSPNASRYCERVLLALRNQPGIERWVVLDMEGVGSIDGTAVASLRGLVDDVGQEGVEVIAVARANPRALDRLGRVGPARIPTDRSSCTPRSAERSERSARAPRRDAGVWSRDDQSSARASGPPREERRRDPSRQGWAPHPPSAAGLAPHLGGESRHRDPIVGPCQRGKYTEAPLSRIGSGRTDRFVSVAPQNSVIPLRSPVQTINVDGPCKLPQYEDPRRRPGPREAPPSRIGRGRTAGLPSRVSDASERCVPPRRRVHTINDWLGRCRSVSSECGSGRGAAAGNESGCDAVEDRLESELNIPSFLAVKASSISSAMCWYLPGRTIPNEGTFWVAGPCSQMCLWWRSVSRTAFGSISRGWWPLASQ